MFAHITGQEVIGMLMAILLVWVLKYSKEKDKSDEINESFSFRKWAKDWFLKRNDNIAAHLVFSFSALFIGVQNVKAWLGDTLAIPEAADEIGAAFIIGFFGSYAVELLKKAL